MERLILVLDSADIGASKMEDSWYLEGGLDGQFSMKSYVICL